MSTREYVVQADGWVLDFFRKTGDVVEASEAQAKYYLMAGQIAAAPAKAVPVKSPRRKRGSTKE